MRKHLNCVKFGICYNFVIFLANDRDFFFLRFDDHVDDAIKMKLFLVEFTINLECLVSINEFNF